jgi:hypothetical protein
MVVVWWWPVVTGVRAGGRVAVGVPCGWLERHLAPQLAGRAGGWEGGGGVVTDADGWWRVHVCVRGARVCAAALRCGLRCHCRRRVCQCMGLRRLGVDECRIRQRVRARVRGDPR